MNPKPLPNADLDALLSDFFKSQLKKPWPNAPVAGAAPAVPSGLASQRVTDAPRNAPSAPTRDNTARARFTLAASVALLLGTGWFLADGFQPGARPGRGAAPGAAPGAVFLPDSSADGKGHEPLQKIGEDKAKGNNGGIKIDVGGIE